MGADAPQFVGTLEAARSEFIDVLARSKGKDGEIKRENARKIQEAMEDGWKMENGQPIGSAIKEMAAFSVYAAISS